MLKIKAGNGSITPPEAGISPLNGNEDTGKPSVVPTSNGAGKQPQLPIVDMDPSTDPSSIYSRSLSQTGLKSVEMDLGKVASGLNGKSGDFAALQHRWSYFQKNAPSLPRKHIASRREKEKLEQVPKLRYL